jgi:LysM repeat protein
MSNYQFYHPRQKEIFMTSSTKIHYSLLMVVALVFVLTGCELARDSSEATDMSPLEALPPTLAPLGSEDSMMANEATGVPTVLSVQATTTPSALEASGASASPIELEVPTSQPPSVPEEPVAENSTAIEVPSAENAEAQAEEQADSQSIVVDAATPEELPEGGPIAANPPASETNPIIPAASVGGTYVVQAGDTLFGISQRYGTTVEAIAAANGLSSDIVQIGQSLAIPGGDEYVAPSQDGGFSAPAPVPGGYYVVTSSDTLFNISQRYGTSVEAIASANNIVFPYVIYPGQRLIIPSYDGMSPGNGYVPNQGYPQQPMGGYYQQPGQGYPQAPADGYYPQPGQRYPQQPPMDGYYQQPDQGYQQPYGDGSYPQAPADGYYPQPGQGYPQQPPMDGYYQQPGQGYQQPGQDGSYYPSPGGYGMPAMPGGAGTHTVAAGETLHSIARRYGVSADAIAGANGLANPNQLFVGQVLYLP